MLLLTAGTLSPATARTGKPPKVAVRFLARGTEIYSSFSGNQAEYLVEVTSPDHVQSLARLLYSHAQSHPGIPDTLIDSGEQQLIRLQRSLECDETYESINTKWLPAEFGMLKRGDGLRFISGVTKPAIEADQVLPCYRVLLRNVRWHGKHIRLE